MNNLFKAKSKSEAELALAAVTGFRATQQTRTYSGGMLDKREAVFKKVFNDLRGLNASAYTALVGLEEGAEKPQLANYYDLPDAVREWSSKAGFAMRSAPAGEGVVLDSTMLLPTSASAYTAEDAERLLLSFGCKEEGGEWDIASHRANPREHTINGNRLMGTGMAVNAFGKVQLMDGPTLFYVIVSSMLTSMVKSLEARAIRTEVLEQIQSAFDSDSLGISDELRAGFNTDKVCQIPVDFGPLGLQLGLHAIVSKKDLYAAMCDACPDMGAHSQGKYFLRMSSVGIAKKPLPAIAKSVTVAPALGTDATKVLVGSTDLAKWFKRSTIGILEQCRLPQPDVGYCRFNGRTQMGKRTPVLVVMGGIPLPYLGASPALQSRKALGEHFAHFVERVHTATLAGEHRVALPEIGTFFKKGDTIVDLPGMPVKAIESGYLLSIRKSVANGDTRVVAKLGRLDTTGQVKSRSMGGAKESIHYLDHTGARLVWPELIAQLGLTVDEGTITQGDVAVLGLKADDPRPTHLRNEDGNKGTGKGASSAVVALASETLGIPTDYSIVKQDNGEYAGLIKQFDEEASREVVTIHSVDPETFEAVNQAIALGITEGSVATHTVTVGDRSYHLVTQTSKAYIAYDLCKVESTPVAAAGTTQRVPGEVTLAARTQGWENVAKELMARGKDQRNEYVQLWRTHGVQFMDLNPADLRRAGVEHVNGDVEVMPLVNLTVGVTPGQAQAIRNLMATEKSLLTGLKTRFAIGVFDETTPYRQGEGGEPAVVVFDPVVFRAFGRGDDESSMVMLARNLLSLILHPIAGTAEGQLQDIMRAIGRLRGAYRSAATSENVAKRNNKGAPALNARSRAAYIPSDWVALASKGSVAYRAAKLSGWDKEECSLEMFYAQGRVLGILFRAPQNAATPQKAFLVDCSDEAYEFAVANGNWPEGVVRPEETMEPDTIVVSREATAADNGDHDGDSRAFAPVVGEEARQELLASDWKSFRRSILKEYQAEVQDPLIYSLEHDPKKLKWGTPTTTDYGQLQSLTDRSIENQTLHIGIAYNHAHAALVVAESVNSGALARAAQGLMFGHYEEQLAGLDDKFYDFYSTLSQAAALGPDFGQAIQNAGAKLKNHSAKDFNMFMQVNSLVNAYGKLRAKFESGSDPMSYLPVFPETGLTSSGGDYEKKLSRAVLAGAYRAISQGRLASNILRFLQEGDSWAIAVQQHFVQWEAKGSIAASIVMTYLREVLPHVSIDMWNGYDSDSY